MSAQREARRRWAPFAGARPCGRAAAVRDGLAGISLAAMSIPQALGYASIAGAPLVSGLYTLVLPLACFAGLGSSRFLVVAADSATAAILAGGLAGMAPLASPRYVELAAAVALLTAALLLLARLLRLGFLADFLSRTVLVGFLAGVGVQVALAVLPEMLGLAARSARTLGALVQVLAGAGRIHPPTAALAAAVVAAVLLLRWAAPRVPGALLAVVAAMAASGAADFPARGIAVIGPVPGGLPRVGLPSVGPAELLALLPLALSCVVMILAQSAATARAYAVQYRQRIDEDADLLGLAAANAAAALSGTFVVNGSPTQTAMLERSGGRSQLANLVAAAVVLAVLLWLTGPLRLLPHCVLGAIVFTIALRLIDLGALRRIRRESPGEYALAVLTAAVVVLVGVEQGILLAMLLSLFRHVRHSYRPHTAVLVADAGGHWQNLPATPGSVSEPGGLVYRFGADLFYANATRFGDEVRALAGAADPPLRWLVIDAEAITNVDYSAACALRELHGELAERGVTVGWGRVGPSLRADMDRHRLAPLFGAERLHASLHEAVAHARAGG